MDGPNEKSQRAGEFLILKGSQFRLGAERGDQMTERRFVLNSDIG